MRESGSRAPATNTSKAATNNFFITHILPLFGAFSSVRFARGLQTELPRRFAALQRGLGRNENQLISARIYHERTDRFKD
jgi:hypothetical protein